MNDCSVSTDDSWNIFRRYRIPSGPETPTMAILKITKATISFFIDFMASTDAMLASSNSNKIAILYQIQILSLHITHLPSSDALLRSPVEFFAERTTTWRLRAVNEPARSSSHFFLFTSGEAQRDPSRSYVPQLKDWIKRKNVHAPLKEEYLGTPPPLFF